MDEKISLSAVDHYSAEFASKIGGAFFAKKEKISGPEILALSEIHQINLFILSDLLHTWKEQSEKIKSPYFDYASKEVAEALNAFQNTLSNHISITKADFLPLLQQAASQTLYLILDPYDYYSDVLDRQGTGYVDVTQLKSDLRYLKINKAPLERLVQKLEEKKLKMIQRNEAFALLDSILEEVGFTPEDIDGYIAQFTAVHTLTVSKLYESKVTVNGPASVPVPEPQKPAPVYQKPEVISQKAQPVVAARSAEKAIKTVAENLQKIGRIKDTLTINQKFMFTKILFHGDFEIFSQAIDRLDVLDNFSQAENFLEKTYPEWDKESVEYLEFIGMLERRFA